MHDPVSTPDGYLFERAAIEVGLLLGTPINGMKHSFVDAMVYWDGFLLGPMIVHGTSTPLQDPLSDDLVRCRVMD